MKKSILFLLSMLLVMGGVQMKTFAQVQNKVNVSKVSYDKTYTDIKIVGELYKPTNFDSHNKYPAIIVVHPEGSVKEQTAGVYAARLAEHGFLTLAFDASYQGESGGQPRYLENPYSRVEDISASVDYLLSLPFVDSERIAVLGISAGGGYAFNAALTEMRIKSVAMISAIDYGRLKRYGLFDSMSAEQQQHLLTQAAKQRTREVDGARVAYNNYVPNSIKEIPKNATTMVRQGYQYFRTPIAKHHRAKNRYIFSNYAQQASFTAFDRPEFIYPRPVLFVVGEDAETKYFSSEAYKKIPANKVFITIKEASHVDLYYRPRCVKQVLESLVEFYDKTLRQM